MKAKKNNASREDLFGMGLGLLSSAMHGLIDACKPGVEVDLACVIVNNVPMLRFEARWMEDKESQRLLSEKVVCSMDAGPKALDAWTQFCHALVQKIGKPVVLPEKS